METKDFIHLGDCIDVMDGLYQEHGAFIDLIFADPPYNLDKAYGQYDDARRDREYLSWCNRWLEGCRKLLKPTGTLFVLNLPKWTTHHAVFLNEYFYLRHWLVWDALSEPRGKVMPAHYGLLYYTASLNDFTFNAPMPIELADQCLRPKCIAKRTSHRQMQEVSDIWYDVHRIKHKRDRDAHPCQLPEKLLERVIGIASNPHDIVFDPFMGTATTAVVAKRMGRHYLGAEIDPSYKEIAERRLQNVFSKRPPVPKHITANGTPKINVELGQQLALLDF